jgi:hypothetical protein
VTEEAKTATGKPTAVALEKMRTTTQWLMGVLGAIGAALIAGVQLSPIGALYWSDWRLPVGMIAFVLALVGVARLLRLAGAVLAPDTTNLDDLTSWQDTTPARVRDELGAITSQLEKQPWLFQGWGPTVRDLKGNYERAVQATQAAYVDNWNADLHAADRRAASHASVPPAPPPASTSRQVRRQAAAGTAATPVPNDPVRDARILRRDVTARRAADINRVVNRVVEQAHFLRFKTKFEALMKALVRWGAVVGAAIFVVAWAASPPDAEAGAAAGAGTDQPDVLDEVVVTLTTAGAAELADALGDGCDLAAVPAIVLDADDASFRLVSTTGTGCRAVRFEVTCATGVVRAATTTGELERIGPRCS